MSDAPDDFARICQSCGACCAYSANWPRCDGDRCAALAGKIGVATSCTIYDVRPEVCRSCMPGDAECDMARKRHGLPRLDRRISPPVD
jgi:uncharacterized protein